MINFDFEALRRIGLTPVIANQLYTLTPQTTGSHHVARITEVHRDTVNVHDGKTAFNTRILPRLLLDKDSSDSGLAVGDWVLTESMQHDDYWVTDRMLPITHLTRRSNDGRRQALASNIDTALLVMGLDADFNLRRMERYLALTHAAGVAAVIVLTKADVSSDTATRVAEVEQRLSASVPVIAVNGQSTDAASALAQWMAAGQTLILLGSSGAGKSTLTNTLASSQQQTGGVRASDGRGQHTTTARSLHLCPGGACIIDTPGLRSLQLDVDEAALSASFEDIEALAELCQFRNCSHQSEPGCAVRETVDADRLHNYQKLLREARRHQQSPLDKIADRAKWKVMMRSVKERDRQKRG
ncbi:ribosome small subunit-dependent GTPase A [Undibacterium sp. TJN19]|uniref:ribosome small subunit-dependent GTPase A n=1 Tax=Undibacterium sp. TJN19 TaxID=3413055 RepID=UPI003BF19D8A